MFAVSRKQALLTQARYALTPDELFREGDIRHTVRTAFDVACCRLARGLLVIIVTLASGPEKPPGPKA